MGVDAIAALAVGKSYDRLGFKTLIIVPLATLPLPFLTLSRHIPWVLGGIILWGVVMAIHETIMRASIADMIPKERRGFAYGVFNMIYGAAWFAGSASMGFLYESSVPTLMGFVVVMELAALLALLPLRNSITASKAG
jgi:predicted MFS family arabinose efflux permease